MSEPASGKMRLDKWLWHARFFKSRSLATQFTAAGNVRINGQKQTRASGNVRPGDVLTFSLHSHVRVIEIVLLSQRRGPASEAQTLYHDREPPQPKPRSAQPVHRPAGTGRPTKKQRRQQIAFTRP